VNRCPVAAKKAELPVCSPMPPHDLQHHAARGLKRPVRRCLRSASVSTDGDQEQQCPHRGSVAPAAALGAACPPRRSVAAAVGRSLSPFQRAFRCAACPSARRTQPVNGRSSVPVGRWGIRVEHRRTGRAHRWPLIGHPQDVEDAALDLGLVTTCLNLNRPPQTHRKGSTFCTDCLPSTSALPGTGLPELRDCRLRAAARSGSGGARRHVHGRHDAIRETSEVRPERRISRRFPRHAEAYSFVQGVSSRDPAQARKPWPERE
jgi:hypothetical protein